MACSRTQRSDAGETRTERLLENPRAHPTCMNVQTTYSLGKTISGKDRPASETPFKWRFAGCPIVVHFYNLTGLRHYLRCLFMCICDAKLGANQCRYHINGRRRCFTQHSVKQTRQKSGCFWGWGIGWEGGDLVQHLKTEENKTY